MSYRQELFRKIFVPAEFAAFRASYEGINPDRLLETAGVSFSETDPLLRSFANENPELISFIDEFLPQLGTFLHRFKDVKPALKADCDSRNPDNPRVTVEGHPAGARAWFTATKA